MMSNMRSKISLILFVLNTCFSEETVKWPTFLSDEEIKDLLNWDTLIPAIEEAMGAVSNNLVVQPSRLFMQLPSKNAALLMMPAQSETEDALGCKVVTSFKNNEEKGLPSVLGTILFMDSDTGKLKVILEGTVITAWRTAAASVVATKHLHRGEKKVLAILGAGTQGRIHALAMKHFFNFTEVRIWNHTPERSKKLCEELGSWAVHYTSNEDCVKGADVIVTATYASSPIVMQPWIKEGAHINAVGASFNHHSELDENLYKDYGTSIFVDHMETALMELKGLVEKNIKLVAEVGQVIKKNVTIPTKTKISVFQSLGMAVEDVLAAKLVYESYISKQNTTML